LGVFSPHGSYPIERLLIILFRVNQHNRTDLPGKIPTGTDMEDSNGDDQPDNLLNCCQVHDPFQNQFRDPFL
jgi:hypothetical protein